MKMSSAQRREEKGKLAHAADVLQWENKIESSCTAILMCNNVASSLNYWLQQLMHLNANAK